MHNSILLARAVPQLVQPAITRDTHLRRRRIRHLVLGTAREGAFAVHLSKVEGGVVGPALKAAPGVRGTTMFQNALVMVLVMTETGLLGTVRPTTPSKRKITTASRKVHQELHHQQGRVHKIHLPNSASHSSHRLNPHLLPPKPEISQKFNAAPKKASTDTPSQQPPQQPPQQPSRDPPPTAPREPASARPRLDTHRPPPEGPRITPRTRKVKKLVRRPKPRPTLPPDLAASESVFFRKPGNESVVGSGTYGKVFKGLNVYTKGLVALKKIRMEGERDGFPVTAVREIKLLQSLRHTNIVNLQEVMVEKNDCYMVFEYLSHDLTGLLNHPTFKLEPAQKKHLAKQLFDGLDYLHNRGVLHRDLKAANILVSNQGILKLADFGLARFYAKRHQLDYTNRVITIWYRSPELLLGETQYTAAVDIWSAACVMVEIFTKHAIFPGDGSELNQLDKIYSVLGTPSRQAWPGVINMPWFELLRPEYKRKSVFKSKYEDRVTPAAFELLESMFLFDPAMRPTAAEVLAHPYFATEEPQPRQAVEYVLLLPLSRPSLPLSIQLYPSLPSSTLLYPALSSFIALCPSLSFSTATPRIVSKWHLY